MTTETEHSDTARSILSAAKKSMIGEGYSGMSTRAIAVQAGVPLSQIHYHFGSKQNLVLAVLERENQKLLARQEEMFESDLPLWKQWDQACDYLQDDLDSGYVRVLHEMIAVGWSDPVIADAVWRQLKGWSELHISVARRAADALDGLGPFTPGDIGALTGMTFLGAEVYLLLGVPSEDLPVLSALRKIGSVIRSLEEAAT